MYNQPNPVLNIDRQIEDLKRLKSTYQTMPQQPINIYNNTNALVSDFKAQFLNENDKVEDLIVQTKTCFISPENGFIAIKEINGDITKYGLIVPKTPEQLQIEELIKKNQELEEKLNGYINSNTNYEITKSRAIDNVENEPTTKTSSRTISKKSE